MTNRLAPAGVGLALFVGLAQIRLGETWSEGALLAWSAAPALALLALAWTAPKAGGRPAAGTSVLVVAGLFLAAIAVLRLGVVVAGRDFGESTGTLLWMLLLYLGTAVATARRTGSAAATFVAAVVLVGAILVGSNWAFGAKSPDTFRAILVVLFFVLLLAGMTAPGRHGVVLVSAAGLTALVTTPGLGLFLLSPLFFLYDSGGAGGWGWQLVTLVQALCLLVYAIREGEPGPAYACFFVLLSWVYWVGVDLDQLFQEGDGGGEQADATLKGWPLVIGAATVLAALWGLRPARRQ